MMRQINHALSLFRSLTLMREMSEQIYRHASNIGTAVNLFNALKLSLIKKGLSFDNCIAFMSDSTNVMKGARSSVQKLIHNECPHLYEVGCICHLAIDVDQLFVDVFYLFLQLIANDLWWKGLPWLKLPPES